MNYDCIDDVFRQLGQKKVIATWDNLKRCKPSLIPKLITSVFKIEQIDKSGSKIGPLLLPFENRFHALIYLRFSNLYLKVKVLLHIDFTTNRKF